MRLPATVAANACLLLLAATGWAQNVPRVDVVPGASQKISHSLSASRDTGLPGYQLTPYSVLTAGIDVGLVGLSWPSFSTRFGFLGLLELESDRP